MRWGLRLAVLALGLWLGAPPLVARAQLDAGVQPAPPEHSDLQYHLTQRVLEGSGAYVGWGDTLVSIGVYTLDGATVHARYDWEYGSPERTDSNVVRREVVFDVTSRNYVDDRTDLDDYDGEPGPLATWLWIPPDVRIGDPVRVLDETLQVRAREPIVVAGATRESIHLHGTSTGHRDDAYGQFTTSAVDDYWFDAATGMFLREHRVERDTGRFSGDDAGFTMDLQVEVVDASYAPAVGAVPPAPTVPEYAPLAEESSEGHPGVVSLLCLGVVLLIGYGLWRLVQNPYRRSAYAVSRLGASEPIPPVGERFSPVLAPFLPHMAEVARRSGSAVLVARRGSEVVGLAIDDADAGILAVHTELSDAAEDLRRESGRLEIVSEYRYRTLESVAQASRATGTKVPEQAYNLYETYDLLSLTLAPDDQPQGYDPELVRRMRPEDVEAASRVAERAYGARCDAFLKASLELGDLAFVAEEDGEIYGLAMATVVGTRARLHSLIVDPDARQRGIGKELYRARLRACADLGVETVVTEVAQQNPAAMDLALRFGMKKIDEMYVQSARQARVEIAPVHR
ncbi:MAG: GNAT family N-acetyltransferase [Sandaracinus sp.]